MSHIFISYSKQDIDFTRYLRALLEAQGFTVWVDEDRLTPSARWWKIIDNNIQTCAAFVIVMSPHSAESDWVEREILLAEKLKRPIFPVLLTGDPWSRLANIQYEDLRTGLRARLSSHFLDGLRNRIPSTERSLIFTIEQGDITTFDADVLAFKYARTFHGADLVMASRLQQNCGIPVQNLTAPNGEYRIVDTDGCIPARQVLYVGTFNLFRLGYEGIQNFAEQTLQTLVEASPNARSLGMTIHGPGFGLDETESLRSQWRGYLKAIREYRFPSTLERITLVEKNETRLAHLRESAEILMGEIDFASPLESGWGYHLLFSGSNPEPSAPVVITSTPPVKPHAFVIMSADPDFEDVFYYGIQTPIHARALLCERGDQSEMTEDVLENIFQRIQTASVVVAEVSATNPNVHLQLGYALGQNRLIILLIKEGYSPPFPLRGVKPLFYKHIKDVEGILSDALDALHT